MKNDAEESSFQVEVSWAWCWKMCFKAGWEQQLLFSSQRDLPAVLPIFSASHSWICVLLATYNAQAERPILQGDKESLKVIAPLLLCSGDRSPLPALHSILTFPH